MDKNLTRKFAAQLLAASNYNKEHYEIAKKCLLDYLGVTIAGAHFIGDKGINLSSLLQNKNGEVSIVGIKCKSSIENAAFLNGIHSHFLELDDGVRFGAVHPGAPVISSLLPVAEKVRLKGEDILNAITIGYEATIKLGYAMQPSHYNKGYHPTATCGRVGSAVAVAIALKLRENELANAISAASLTAAGSLKVLEGGSDLKAYNVANAAIGGVMATRMAEAGFVAPEDVFSGRNGFFELMADGYNKEVLFGTDKRCLEINNVYFKIYAACRHCHAGIEAVLRIRKRKGFSYKEVAVIKVFTYDYVIGKHDHKAIQGISSAKMSLPFSIALSLVFGHCSNDLYSEETIYNREINELIGKIDVVEEESLTKIVPNKRPAIVEIEMKNGTIFKERVDFPKGEPENPLSFKEVIEKFNLLLCQTGKTDREINQIIDCVVDLENKWEELYECI